MEIPHYLIDPGKPAQNGKVERSHRTDQEKFYDENKFKSFEDLKQKKENGTLSPDERKEYLQLSLDNNKKQYTNKMAKIEDNSGGGKRKTIKAKKRKTRKGKKIRKRSQRR